MQALRRYAYAWLTLGFFAVSFILHWVFGWYAYADAAQSHNQTPEMVAYLVEMGRDTFENWQSEFLQLIWQVVGLAYFLYVGSPASKENGDRTEAKIDALLELVGKEKGLALIQEIDDSHDRHSGHAKPHRVPSHGGVK